MGGDSGARELRQRDGGPRTRGRGAPAGRDRASERGPGDGSADSLSSGDGVPTRSTPPAKRAADLLFSLIGFLLTAPVWVVLPLLIKIEDGGPVFFAQERVGKGGEHFTSWKFRSMRPRQDAGDGPTPQAALDADRITRIGRFMRPCALDELPQLWNVLRGDMSLVGPRALVPEEVEHRGDGDDPVRLEELPGYGERHSVRPGLTGLAQVSTARDRPHRQKFDYDVLYVRNRSLWLDLELIARSVVISLAGGWPEVDREDNDRDRLVSDEVESPA